ncbi:Crp/Fnr family transcriptional regulator [Magnetospirillum sulfuroxidans]|uniref:Crp/Fnr family transcriptional regulator n=1 Tax=Magnetospirillum sulfuroxidans TaxID=611300 RepID=A0ABS5ID41_9PROT|nr:Crp/Fnr family transcriptional regulator [Magnetospirillum sulfuroxidans]
MLNRRKCIRQLARGEVLFHQGDVVSSLYRLLDGIVLMRQVDSGGTVVTPHMACAGATIGFRAFVDGGVHGVSAVCATDVVLCRIPADVAAQAFSGSHPLERAFARHVAAELSETEDFVLAMTSRPVRDRLLLVFARLYRQFGCHGENGVCRLPLPLLRSDIAGLAGIARETFSRAMHALEEEGLVRLEGDCAVFPDIVSFRRQAELIQPGAWAS